MKKYDLSKIMKRAWEIKNEDSENLFGECLRMAWGEAKKTKDKESFIDLLISAGASRWQKYGYDRLYVRGCEELFGLYVERYNTGNISYCELGGEKISNGRGRAYADAIENGYIDMATMRFCAKYANKNCVEYFNDVLEEKIA